ncbi:hypothetical protein BH23GEM4_BH23GEM4_04140 [soil metagenome]
MAQRRYASYASSVSLLLFLLALLGLAALLVRLGRSLLRLLLASARSTTADGMADLSARRGDLTLLAERDEQARLLASARRLEWSRAALWAALLILPPLFGAALYVYPAAVLLWLLPRNRRTNGTPRQPPPHLP